MPVQAMPCSHGVPVCRGKRKPNSPQAAALTGEKIQCSAFFMGPAAYQTGWSAQDQRV